MNTDWEHGDLLKWKGNSMHNMEQHDLVHRLRIRCFTFKDVKAVYVFLSKEYTNTNTQITQKEASFMYRTLQGELILRKVSKRLRVLELLYDVQSPFKDCMRQ